VREGPMTRRSAMLWMAVALVVSTLLGGVALWAWHSITLPQEKRVRERPYVPLKKLIRMPYYKRSCRHAEDCPAPLSCLMDFRFLAEICRASECDSELQCTEGEVCQPVDAIGPPVRLCLPRGVAAEGARCSTFPLTTAEACQPGLLCNYGYCGRKCRIGQPADCPRGTFCREYLGETSCAPTCLETGCPSGLECVSPVDSEEKLSLCVKVVSDGCLKNPCPPGEECIKELAPSRQTLAASCIARCSGEASCARGDTCHKGYCRHPCRIGVPGDCGPDYVCNPFFHGDSFCVHTVE